MKNTKREVDLGDGFLNYINYDYKLKNNKNRNKVISTRDIGENALVGTENKGNVVKLMMLKQEKTIGMEIPKELLDKLYLNTLNIE